MVDVVERALVVSKGQNVVVAQAVKNLDPKGLGALISLAVDVTFGALHRQVTGNRHHLGTVGAQGGQAAQVYHGPQGSKTQQM